MHDPAWVHDPGRHQLQGCPDTRIRAAHRLFLVNIGLQVCDALLTYFALSLGFQEGNPLIQATIERWGPGWGLMVWKAEARAMLVMLRSLARYPVAVVALAVIAGSCLILPILPWLGVLVVYWLAG